MWNLIFPFSERAKMNRYETVRPNKNRDEADKAFEALNKAVDDYYAAILKHEQGGRDLLSVIHGDSQTSDAAGDTVVFDAAYEEQSEGQKASEDAVVAILMATHEVASALESGLKATDEVLNSDGKTLLRDDEKEKAARDVLERVLNTIGTLTDLSNELADAVKAIIPNQNRT